MDELLSEHHKLIKFLLSAVGLWPYERTYFVYVKRVAYALLALSAIVFQLAAFLQEAVYSQNTIVMYVKNVTLAVLVMYKHTYFLYRIEFLREIFDSVTRHRTSITDENERRIIFTHIADVNAKNRSFAIIFYLSVCVYLLYELLTNNYNNFTDDLDIHIKMYYFTDNPKFIYVMHLHTILLMVLGMAGLVGPELATVVLAHHACALFQIVRYRVKTAFVESSGMSDFEKDRLAMDKLISATKLHKVTIKYAGQLAKCLCNSYFLLIILGVMSLSLNLLRMVQSLQQQGELKELMIELLLISAHIMYLCLINYICQIVMNSSAELFTELCNCRWYTVSVRTQKLLLFFIHHSTKTYTFLVGGLFVPGFEGFGMLLKMSFSYFTVMYSAPV